MIMSPAKHATGARALGASFLLALGLGLLLLVGSALDLMGTLGDVVARRSTLARTVGVQLWGTPLAAAAIGFVLAQLCLHLLFGVFAWLLALLTASAFPRYAGWRSALTLGWFAALVAWLLIANNTLYPSSQTGLQLDWMRAPLLPHVRLFELTTVVIVVTIGILVARNLLMRPKVRAALPRAGLYGALLLTALVTANVLSNRATGAEDAPGSKPNIILVGIDSLRSDAVGEGRGLGVTPNLDVFLREAHVFTDAITPLARTYPSWVSVLTGLNPRSSGARENLMPREMLRKFATLGEIVKPHGYRTVYATDEVRFSNIDAAFGFDQVVAPTIGAADFLLGRVNDLPLSNLLANTPVARWLFPATYANRAAFRTYRPETFVEWVDDAVQVDGPTLMAIHLTLPHWPYYYATRDDRPFDRIYDRIYAYQAAVIAADRQFGALLEVLERKGALHNSIVVVFSDHGEALGIPSTDTLVRGAGGRRLLDSYAVNLWGHGTSILSPHQFGTVLAIRSYGQTSLPAPDVHPDPVSLVDLAPTLLEAASMPTEQRFDGVSLMPVLRRSAERSALQQRARFTETGFRTPLMARGELDEAGLFDEAAAFFQMNPRTSRIEVRAALVPRLLADKERAAMTGRWLIAAVPLSPDAQDQVYVLVDRHGQSAPRRLRAAPDAVAEPDVARLWADMHAHYGPELLPPRQ